MNCRIYFSRYLRLVVLLVVAGMPMLLLGAACADEPQPATQSPEPVGYQLVNVTIPADSPIRKATNINNPPAIYVIVCIKGEQIGKASQARRGWEVDFEVKDRNMWPIWADSRKIYSLEVWDANRFADDLIFSITGIAGKDFEKVIYEKGSVNLPKDRLATVRFEAASP